MTAWFEISHQTEISFIVFCSALNLAFLNDVEMVTFVTLMQDVLVLMEYDHFETITDGLVVQSNVKLTLFDVF